MTTVNDAIVYVTAILTTGGVAVAVPVIVARTARRARPLGACSCGHAPAVHDLDARTCQAETRRAHYNRVGSRNGHEWVRCPCVNFDGTPPLSTFRDLRLPLPE